MSTGRDFDRNDITTAPVPLLTLGIPFLLDSVRYTLDEIVVYLGE